MRYGYVNVTDMKAMAQLAEFLTLEADVVSKEMKVWNGSGTGRTQPWTRNRRVGSRIVKTQSERCDFKVKVLCESEPNWEALDFDANNMVSFAELPGGTECDEAKYSCFNSWLSLCWALKTHHRFRRSPSSQDLKVRSLGWQAHHWHSARSPKALVGNGWKQRKWLETVLFFCDFFGSRRSLASLLHFFEAWNRHSRQAGVEDASSPKGITKWWNHFLKS